MTRYRGILLYNPIDTAKNEWFINSFIETAANNNISLTLMLTTDFYPLPVNTPVSLRMLVNKIGFVPDFVINRSRDYVLAQVFEIHDIRVFNPSYITRTANDKDLTYNYLQKIGIQHLPYITIPMEYIREDMTSVISTVSSFGYPFVLKPAEGHGGAHVSLINSESELLEELSSISNEDSYNKLLIQKCASDTGKDLRAYVMNGKVLSCIMRSSETDFRANFSLGGESQVHIPSEEENKLLEKIISALPSDFIGIDFVYDNGKPVLNEVEDAVGCRMLYANTDINIIEEYISYILEVL